ncbi:MAG: Multidrug resistance protein MdtB [Smithella sp. PtaU1.Bin162]|nr:MAG: Multidrug resistance protein MdtB [Smithella sp. PtaU1.Bin162]
MTILVMVSVLFFGIFSYRSLPINNLPNVDYPTIQVTANVPGASPETMASVVATPLEKEFTKIAGLESMSSQNTLGQTTITLQFSLEKNIDAAAQDVNTAISASRGLLPDSTTMPNPPTYKKTNPADQPIMYFIMTSESMPMSEVQDYAESFVTGYLSTIDGVAEVKVMGSQKKAFRIKIDPDAMAAKGIGLNEVADAVKLNNVNMPGGSLDGDYQNVTLDSGGQLTSAAAYNKLVITRKNGNPVRIEDIGRAVDGVDYEKAKLWFLTRDKQYTAIVLAISKQPGSNTVRIAEDIRKAVPRLTAMMPKAIEIFLLYDQSVYINESIEDVQFTLLLTIGLVILVIFLFIRSWKPTIIPGIAVPLSIIATFAVMYKLGYSLNNLSLMALTLSVGFVVDDAVVMMENIIRRMEMGESAMEASLIGSKEIGFTILSMTLSLIVVFIPILFMGGIIGRLFREFAVSIGVAILVSGIISLTLTPMLCSRMLQGVTEKKKGRFYEFSERIFEGMLDFYSRSLKWVLVHRRWALLFTLVTIAASVFLFMMVKKGFIPSQDQDYFLVASQADDRVSFDYMVAHQEIINGMLRKEPDTKAVFAYVGGGSNNSGFALITLNEGSKRKESVDQIINRIRPEINSVPGVMAFPFNPPPISVGGRHTNAAWQFTLQTNNLSELYTYAERMKDKMAALPGLADVQSDVQVKSPRIQIEVDREKAAALGLNFSKIQEMLFSAFGSRSVSTIYSTSNEYYVYLELAEEFRRDPSALAKLYIKSDKGKLVPLSTIARIEEKVVPLSVNHSGQLPSATISFNLREGYPIDKAMEAINGLARTELPANITGQFEGAGAAFSQSFGNLGFLLLVTVFIIYVVLGILYESFIHPVTILSALPLAGFGAILSLLVFNLELDIYAFVGIIMLVGLVKKNGIMMVDFALEAEKKENLDAEASIYQACIIRFRPIMMTTMAALLGALPIAIGFGAGGSSRQPLGVAVVGGLLFSQMLTLYVTPVFYIYLDKLNRRRRKSGR